MQNSNDHIWLASYPRSGNTLARYTIEAMYGVPTFTPHPEPGYVAGGNRPIPAESQFRVIKTHILKLAFQFDRKAIYIVRDGRDALVSQAHYHRAFNGEERPFDVVLRKLVEGKYPSADVADYWYNWGSHVKAWFNRPTPTAVIRFEELIQEPRGMMAQAFRFLGYELQDQGGAIPTFEQLHEREPKFYRRGDVGTWRDEMPEEIEALFWKHHGDAMKLAGYDRKLSEIAAGV